MSPEGVRWQSQGKASAHHHSREQGGPAGGGNSGQLQGGDLRARAREELGPYSLAGRYMARPINHGDMVNLGLKGESEGTL